MIPVFYHKPKCCGTLIQYPIMMKNLRKKALVEFGAQLLHTSIIENNRTVASFFSYATSDLGPYKMEDIKQTYYLKISFEELENIIHKTHVLSLVISPAGFKNHHKYEDAICKGEPLERITVLRDPIDAQQSLFYYLRDFGNWERNFGMFEGMTFGEYINSDKISDSWLIRNITGIPDEKPITEDDYYECKNFLSSFAIIGFKERFNDFLKEIDGRYQWKYEMNEEFSNTNNISSRISISDNDLEKFNKITHYDKKIYDHFYQIGLK
jgi:hypothetical protein